MSQNLEMGCLANQSLSEAHLPVDAGNSSMALEPLPAQRQKPRIAELLQAFGSQDISRL
jgi:hypothetical protein